MSGDIAVDRPREAVLLAIADDQLLTGHRASHWTGVAPSLEEDLAFSTIAQDGINHADLWYQLVVGDGSDDVRAGVDALGLGRAPDAYRHAIVCERPPGDFAYTLARHWAFDHFESVRLTALSDSTDAQVAALAVKLLHEQRYHLEHAELWLERITGAGGEARARLQAGFSAVLPEALGLFEPVAGEDAAVASGLLRRGHAQLHAPWLEAVAPRLEAVGLGAVVPAADATVPAGAAGGRDGHHSADFTEDVWPEMTRLYREHPGARW
ncbi:MAG: 1,2-phenylacetyl-CoA epoxidase subunit PaaC [Nitriliruptoraceae bacterium]